MREEGGCELEKHKGDYSPTSSVRNPAWPGGLAGSTLLPAFLLTEQ